MDKPSEWTEIASEITAKVRAGFVGPDVLGWHGTRDAIAEALTAAHEAGRKAGLEEAAGVCEKRAVTLANGALAAAMVGREDSSAELRAAAREAKDCADAIRAAGEVRGG